MSIGLPIRYALPMPLCSIVSGEPQLPTHKWSRPLRVRCARASVCVCLANDIPLPLR